MSWKSSRVEKKSSVYIDAKIDYKFLRKICPEISILVDSDL